MNAVLGRACIMDSFAALPRLARGCGGLRVLMETVLLYHARCLYLTEKMGHRVLVQPIAHVARANNADEEDDEKT
jgi:hypothetical protein